MLKTMNYEKAVSTITSKGKFHISLGLERIGSALDLLGNPQDALKFIHVAGTNGKGSVCSILASVLKDSGLRVGLFTSPHLLSYTERIKINGEDISEADFGEYVSRVINKSDAAKIHLTEFEILTAAAFCYFKDRKTEVVVLETGLGGRFDATNIIKSNVCSIITSISLDHTERLGNTLEKIATEKAGIIKDTPTIISEENSGFETIKNKAKTLLPVKNDVEIMFEHKKNYAKQNGKSYEFPLLGPWQKDNLALVFTAIDFLRNSGYEIPETAVESGLKNAKWPSRMEYISEKNLIFDGAHNPAGAKALKSALDFYFSDEKLKFIYGTLKNKDYKGITKSLFRTEDKVYFLEFDYPNSLKYEEFVKNTGVPAEKITESDVANILKTSGLKVVCGSFYMLGNLLAKKII